MLPPLLLALVVGLGACSGDPEPIIEPTPSATAPASPTSEPTPTADPEPESAKAFLQRWQLSAYDMQDSGDVDNYLAMTSSCTSCVALAEGVEEIYAQGGSIKTTGGQVSGIERVGKVDRTFIYEYVTTSGASKVFDRSGRVEDRYTGGTSRFQVNLERRGKSWVVRRVSRLAT